MKKHGFILNMKDDTLEVEDQEVEKVKNRHQVTSSVCTSICKEFKSTS